MKFQLWEKKSKAIALPELLHHGSKHPFTFCASCPDLKECDFTECMDARSFTPVSGSLRKQGRNVIMGGKGTKPPKRTHD